MLQETRVPTAQLSPRSQARISPMRSHPGRVLRGLFTGTKARNTGSIDLLQTDRRFGSNTATPWSTQISQEVSASSFLDPPGTFSAKVVFAMRGMNMKFLKNPQLRRCSLLLVLLQLGFAQEVSFRITPLRPVEELRRSDQGATNTRAGNFP